MCVWGREGGKPGEAHSGVDQKTQRLCVNTCELPGDSVWAGPFGEKSRPRGRAKAGASVCMPPNGWGAPSLLTDNRAN